MNFLKRNPIVILASAFAIVGTVCIIYGIAKNQAGAGALFGSIVIGAGAWMVWKVGIIK